MTKSSSTYAYDTGVAMDDGTVIRTTVTNSGDAVKQFLQEVNNKHGQRLIVGLDTEWRVKHRRDGHKDYRTAVLQLCVGHRCLVFQIARSDHVPAVLRAFLACPDHSFVGVGVDNDVERLYDDCGLYVANAVDLTYVAAEALSRPELRRAGLKALTREVMGVHIDKDKAVTMSEWGRPRLLVEQVRYACVDAFVSFEVGRLLLGGDAETGETTARYVPFELP